MLANLPLPAPTSFPRSARLLAGALACGVVLAACGTGGVAPSTSPSATTSASSNAPSTPASVAGSPGTTLDSKAALTQTYATTTFIPAFTVTIPAAWTPVERDESAFQAYMGTEDYEITFDHTYQRKETLAEALGRLKGTAGITVERDYAVTVGGRDGLAFDASSATGVAFTDSGFHTNSAARLGIAVVSLEDGTTLTIFLTSSIDPMHGLEPLLELATRIFATVEWR